MKEIAEVGLLPKNMDKDPIPKCAGCMFSVTTKKPCLSKGNNTGDQVRQMTKISRTG